MAFDIGIFNDLSDTNTIADPIVLATASAIQLPFSKGRIWQDFKQFVDPVSTRKFDIYSRSETSRGGAIGDNWSDGTGTSGLKVADASGLNIGLTLKIESEVVWISAVDKVANTIDVVRGVGGTTGVAHVDATAFSVTGSAIADEDLKDIGSISETTNIFTNYMQTVAEAIDFTKGGQLDKRDGLSDAQLALLQQEAMLRAVRNMARTTVMGFKQEASGSVPWMTAGIIQQLSDSTGGRLVLEQGTVGALNEAKLRTALRAVTDRGLPNTIYVSSANKDVINGFNASDTAVSVMTGRTDTQAGYHVNTYDYEGLVLDVKVDADMPNDVIAIVNTNKCYRGWKKGDELSYHDEVAKSSREFRSTYNGSFGIAIEDVGYEHIIMTGVTQS